MSFTAYQSTAPLALGSSQYATGSVSRVQDHEIDIRSTEGGSGNVAVNSLMNAGPAAAVFSGVNTMNVSGCSFNFFQKDVKLVQNGKKRQIIETDEQDD